MSEYSVDVYLPSHFLQCASHYLFGFYKFDGNHLLINCLFAISTSSDEEQEDIKRFYRSINCPGLKFFHSGYICSNDIQCGIPQSLKLGIKSNFFTFLIQFNGGSGSVTLQCTTFKKTKIAAENARLILFEGLHFSRSHPVQCNRDINSHTDFENTFVDFLKRTIDLGLNYSQPFKDISSEFSFVSSVNLSKPYVICDGFLKVLLCTFWCLTNFCEKSFPISRFPTLLAYLIRITEVGKQLHARFLQFTYVCQKRQKNKNALSLCARNIVFAIFLDLILGWLVTYHLRTNLTSKILLNDVMYYTNNMVNMIEDLIHWLMGVPAGLKLNIPLNSALGHFFLYHIYLWKSYMTIVEPIFAFLLQTLMSFGCIGFTFIPSLCNDIMAFATVHIYIFYGYAARIFHYQLLSLSYLWRLFRGKKWNPETLRIETHQYDTHQLYIGTMVFTVLFFLLPTVMVYYFVFTSLRIFILAFQGIISKITRILTTLPTYAIVLWLFNSDETKGILYFNVVQVDPVLVLSLQVLQMPLTSVLKETVPKSNEKERPLTWKEFFSFIVWGKIIYPI